MRDLSRLQRTQVCGPAHSQERAPPSVCEASSNFIFLTTNINIGLRVKNAFRPGRKSALYGEKGQTIVVIRLSEKRGKVQKIRLEENWLEIKRGKLWKKWGKTDFFRFACISLGWSTHSDTIPESVRSVGCARLH